jgi:hypothetical protein
MGPIVIKSLINATQILAKTKVSAPKASQVNTPVNAESAIKARTVKSILMNVSLSLVISKDSVKILERIVR